MPLIRKELKSDDVTARLAKYSTAEFRVWVAVAFFAAIIAGACASMFSQGVTAVVAGCLTLITLVVAGARLRRERLLLHNYKTAVATVSEWRRTEGVDGGYLYEIRYRFLVPDGTVYVGSSGACSRELPHQGDTVPVLYRADDPNENLTLASFWFYAFSYTGTE